MADLSPMSTGSRGLTNAQYGSGVLGTMADRKAALAEARASAAGDLARQQAASPDGASSEEMQALATNLAEAQRRAREAEARADGLNVQLAEATAEMERAAALRETLGAQSAAGADSAKQLAAQLATYAPYVAPFLNESQLMNGTWSASRSTGRAATILT